MLFLYFLRRNVWGPKNSAKKSSIYHHIPREILQCISLINYHLEFIHVGMKYFHVKMMRVSP